MPIIFPEIDWVRNFSDEGNRLIDDALNCLYNAFNNDNKGSITYRKLCEGLLILCDDLQSPTQATTEGPQSKKGSRNQ